MAKRKKIGSVYRTEKTVRIACVSVGRKQEPSSVGKGFQRLRSCLPARFHLQDFGSAFEEPEILERIERVSASRPDLVLLKVLHGSSARSVTLAAVKSSVPAVIWCHNAEYSLASSSLAADTLHQLKHPYLLIHGEENPAVAELTAAASAAASIRRLAEDRIGQLGPLHFNLIGNAVNPLILQERFGTWVVPLSLSTLRSALVRLDPRRLNEKASALAGRFSITADKPVFKKAVALSMVLADFARQHRLDAISTDCWQEIMPEFGVSPCLGSLVGNFPLGCEGDLVLVLTLLAGEVISGRPGYGGDLCSLNENDGTAVLIHCGGFAGLHSGAGRAEIVSRVPPGPAGQNGTVVSCHPVMKPGPATLVKLHGQPLNRLHLRRGQILQTGFPEQMEVTLRLEGEMGSFLREVAGNHYLVFSGDSTSAWKLWAEWSGITVH